MNDSLEPRARADQTPFPQPERSRLAALFDKLWPHLAAWGLAALLAFFTVRERITLMERDGAAMLERIKQLEEVDRRRETELRGIHDNTTQIRTLVEDLVHEAKDRRAEERRAYRERLERGER